MDRRVVAKRLADVRVVIDITRTEDEAAAQLKWVPAELVLPESAVLRALARLGVVGSKQMKQIRGFEAGGLIGRPLVIDQQGKFDAGFFPEHRSVARVSQSDGAEPRSLGLEFLFMFTQLRDMLAAEDSAVMPEEDNHRGTRFPKRAEPDRGSVGVGQGDAGQ